MCPHITIYAESLQIIHDLNFLFAHQIKQVTGILWHVLVCVTLDPISLWFDFQQEQTIGATFGVSDGVNSIVTEMVTISVQDCNDERPVFVQGTFEIEVSEVIKAFSTS